MSDEIYLSKKWSFSFTDEKKRLGKDWISVEDELPNVTNQCLVKFECGTKDNAFYYHGIGWKYSQAFTLSGKPLDLVYAKVTHWRYSWQ